MKLTLQSFYKKYSAFTFPGEYESELAQVLPNSVQEIGRLVRNSTIHRMVLKNGNTGSNSDLRYGDMNKVPWYRQAEDDYFVTAAAMIAELYRRDKLGFITHRSVNNRLVVTCRHVSVLMASLLKTKGIPARVRSGFSPYFVVDGLPGGKSDDHWINEYWNEKENRWIAIDVDGSLEGYLKFDPYNIPPNIFDYSADAWLKVRKGQIEAQHFWNAGGRGGLDVMSWELFYDFHCLMNNEIIYLHVPEFIWNGLDKLHETELKEIDNLAELMQSPNKNFDELQNIWNTNKKFRKLKGASL